MELPETQKTFHKYDVFQGLTTQIFIYNFHFNDISATKIPPVQHLLQQPDLTVNKFF